MKQIELSAGTIEYQDTGGDGPALVLLHGLMMDASLWDGPIADLAADHRCIAPTLPLGAHRHAMRADADLSLPGIARLVWASEDRVMPPEHGRRLAEVLPQGRLVEVADSYTLIPLDQPIKLARVIREFTRASART
jgi:pimeloyl-ACP methyl ester carboxylesterase